MAILVHAPQTVASVARAEYVQCHKQVWNLSRHNVPDYFIVDSNLGVRHDITESRDLSPSYIRGKCSTLAWNMFRRFPDDFEVPQDGIVSFLVRFEFGKIDAIDITKNFLATGSYVVNVQSPVTRHVPPPVQLSVEALDATRHG